MDKQFINDLYLRVRNEEDLHILCKYEKDQFSAAMYFIEKYKLVNKAQKVNPAIDYDDLYQELVISVTNYIKNFDKARGIYFYNYIDSNLKYIVHNLKSYNESKFEKNWGVVEFKEDYFNSENPAPPLNKDRDIGFNCRLSAKQKEVLDLMFNKKYNQNQIAANFKCTRSSVNQIKQKAFSKLRSEIIKKGANNVLFYKED